MKRRRPTARNVADAEAFTFLYHQITGGNDPIEPVGDGVGDGYGYGYGHGLGILGFADGGGHADGHAWGHHGAASGGEICFQVLPMTSDEGRRTERVLLCAGCVGGFECPLHGRRL